MIKHCLNKWEKNKKRLRENIAHNKEIKNYTYKDLLKLVISIILNDGEDEIVDVWNFKLDIDNITEIDNGNYQGTLLYVVPFQDYNPAESDYLMTFVSYGSCSGCDTLLHIQADYENYGDELPTKQQVKDYMALAKDLITNFIKPYNYGWRNNAEFDVVEQE